MSLGLYDRRFEHDACGIGFVVDIQGRGSNQILRQALTVLENLDHRGARGAEANTGDGAGILLQVPHRFLQKTFAGNGLALPPAGEYGVGMLFLPQDPDLRSACRRRFEKIAAGAGVPILGWRRVPTDNGDLGETALVGEPAIFQVFVGRPAAVTTAEPFERLLYVIRRQAEQALREPGRTGSRDTFYIASLSHRTLVYKGMLTARQLRSYYPDLSDPTVKTALALVHSRFSTNTFPSWERAHPNRYLIHNGEINTLRGNVNWMRAREALFASDRFGGDLPKSLPIIDEEGSDSAMFDNCLEILTLAGRSLPHAVMMMIPEPWSKHREMSPEKRAFYAYHSCLMEPWDGPAAIAFTDGVQVGAVLDRNGLRPARYLVTADDLLVMASETGVLDLPPECIVHKGRLQPGRMLLIDTAEGRIVDDEELKHRVAMEHPYQQWLDTHLIDLEQLSTDPQKLRVVIKRKELIQQQQAFGYTYEDLRVLLAPMAKSGVDPVGSMGDDAPPAILSERPQLLYDYFRQLFAQVTNPPIDAIREEMITSSEMLLGSEGNLLDPKPAHCCRIRLQTAILTNDDVARLRGAPQSGFKVAELDISFRVAHNSENHSGSLDDAIQEICAVAGDAIRGGANILILSDRRVDRLNAPVPALLATGALHHHLIRCGLRTQVSLVVESGEPRTVHHFATLIGYGADAVNPYLALDSIGDLVRRGLVTEIDARTAVAQYVKASTKGVVKVSSKMGISTLQSYHGAQIFEALGLHPKFVEAYFSGTPSRIGGIGLETIAHEAAARHRRAFPSRSANGHTLPEGGRFKWRYDGEPHLFSPATIHRLQHAVRAGDYEAYKAYATAVNDQNEALCTLRGLLQLRPAADPLPLDAVEPLEAILRRFKTGAMSYGSISQEAHESLAIAMNRIGGKSNTGEGGEDPARYRPDLNGDSRNSAIKQVASGRFGVTSDYLVHAQEIQIKMAQGAKPGEGGQLPGHKVYPWIARVRHSTPGVGLISPPPHHDIYSIEDLAQLIYDLKNANPQARVSVKLVSEVGVGTVAAGVAKGHADVILISGHDGGTGASPLTSIKHAGLPWELGVAETHQTLVRNRLRDRVALETDGQLKTGRDLVIAALLGAEEFGFATAPLVALGCIMMRVCHLDTCPVGVATQNPELRAKFTGDPQHVVNFMRFVAQDLREWMAMLGFRTIDEMVGRVDRLEANSAVDHWKARGLDFSNILHWPEAPPEVGRTCQVPQDHGLDQTLDRLALLERCRPALEEARPVKMALPIDNGQRTVGTMLGSEITRRYGADGLPEDTIELHFQGSAGQSFGAFIPRGLTLTLEGDANDYIGKGLSGGKVIVYPPRSSGFVPEENIIVGNVAFYGATGGEAYVYGKAGERFCVRNSGLHAVVEAVGDHGCEYMTGGRVVVLGPTGRNFAAGMSGGVAYVLDEDGVFPGCCNLEMVDLERLVDADEIAAIEAMIWRHAFLTGSRRAWRILRRWENVWPLFVKVMPRDYRRMLIAIEQARKAGLDGDEAVMAAFEANKQDKARITGN